MSQAISILHFVARVAAVKAVLRRLARAVWARVIQARWRLMGKGG
ncbi:MAG: hypothetical protein NVV73_14360 [Cellvibrionaceae bacterium]|nr:hypothetical protein [Cellvibrionaceae bacterium]